MFLEHQISILVWFLIMLNWRLEQWLLKIQLWSFESFERLCVCIIYIYFIYLLFKCNFKFYFVTLYKLPIVINLCIYFPSTSHKHFCSNPKLFYYCWCKTEVIRHVLTIDGVWSSNFDGMLFSLHRSSIKYHQLTTPGITDNRRLTFCFYSTKSYNIMAHCLYDTHVQW